MFQLSSGRGQHVEFTIWRFRPLWRFVCEVAEDLIEGMEELFDEVNDADERDMGDPVILELKVVKGALLPRMKEWNRGGRVRRYLVRAHGELDSMRALCPFCDGVKFDPIRKEDCDRCDEEGIGLSRDAYYKFTLVDYLELMKFFDNASEDIRIQAPFEDQDGEEIESKRTC